MIFAEKERRQEERKESEIKKNLGTSRSTISSSFGCNEASLSMECSISTVDPSDEKMEEDADEEPRRGLDWTKRIGKITVYDTSIG